MALVQGGADDRVAAHAQAAQPVAVAGVGLGACVAVVAGRAGRLRERGGWGACQAAGMTEGGSHWPTEPRVKGLRVHVGTQTGGGFRRAAGKGASRAPLWASAMLWGTDPATWVLGTPQAVGGGRVLGLTQAVRKFRVYPGSSGVLEFTQAVRQL